MKKTKLTRSLLAACSIVALSAVMYGCTSDGSERRSEGMTQDDLAQEKEADAATQRPIWRTAKAAADAAAKAEAGYRKGRGGRRSKGGERTQRRPPTPRTAKLQEASGLPPRPR